MRHSISPVVSIILSLCIISSVTYAEVINIPDDFETIQAGIDESEDGDTVLVQPGEYRENIRIENRYIVLASLTLLTSDPSYIDSTIIDGDNRARVVILDTPERSETVVQGFTITRGTGYFGAGITCYFSGEVVLKDLLITENTAEAYGGGISIRGGGQVRMERVRIINNSVSLDRGEGGGISINPGRLIMDSCQITANRAWYGAACSIFGTITASHLVVDRNEATFSFGGIYIMDGVQNYPYNFEHITVFGNSAPDDRASGIYIASPYNESLEVVLYNSVIYANSGCNLMIGGSEEYQDPNGESNLRISYCDLEGGVDRIQLLEGGNITEGEGNIDADPLFVDPDEGDYHLTEDSPCIDAGDPETDLDPDGTHPDMGAFYFHQRDIVVEPEALEFVDVQTGMTDSLTVIIRNIGLTPLQITAQTITPEDAPFAVRPAGEVEIEPESEHLAWVFFSPEAEEQYEAIFRIESNDPDEAVMEIPITGSALGIGASASLIPRKFAIVGIYPNPFNSSTTITYELPFASRVSLQVFNMSGSKVASLADSHHRPGRYNAHLTADNLPSGLYMVRLEASGHNYSKKALLMK